MPPSLAIKDIARETRVVRGRVLAASVFVLILALILVARLVQLQVVEYEHFSTLSEDNRVKIVPVAPTRGLIFDRNGVVLAQNLPTYSLEIVPESVDDLDALIERLREVVAITEADEERFHSLLRKKRRFESVPVRTRLNDAEVAQFSVNRHRFPAVDVHARLTRNYPLGPVGVHLVGYVGRINEAELERIDTTNYRGSSHIGKVGVEQAFEDVLHGTVGYQHVETNAAGRTLRVLERRDPVPGSNLYLTIDANLQIAAEEALAGENGAVVAIDPANGQVLAFASMPGFDPNPFVDGIDADAYRALLRSPDRPLFNRALTGQYPPGSTIKPFVGLAGLETKVEHVHDEIWCPGWYQLPGRKHRYRDWKKWGHGKVDLQRAIVESCDVYFYELALGLGIDRMHRFLARFGLGERTGIELIGESPGLVPSREWKRRVRNQPWYPGETLIAGIGQGFTLTTPLQLASATATLAMRGVRLKPRVVARRYDPVAGTTTEADPETVTTVAPADAANWNAVIEAMTAVVHGPRGTARRISNGITYKMAGKTGTSQVVGIGQDEEYEAEKIEKKLRDHGLFVAFAPIDQPRIAVAVLVENGGSGSRSAAPIARRVIDRYMIDRRDRRDSDKLLLTAAPGGESASDRQ